MPFFFLMPDVHDGCEFVYGQGLWICIQGMQVYMPCMYMYMSSVYLLMPAVKLYKFGVRVFVTNVCCYLYVVYILSVL